MVTVCHEGWPKPETQFELSELCTAQLLMPPPADEIPIAFWAVASEVIAVPVPFPFEQKVLLPWVWQ
jgi:hypothetical protein